MEVSGKLNERLGEHQGVFQEYSAGGASRATTLFTVLVLVSKGNRAAILGRPPRWLYSNRLWVTFTRSSAFAFLGSSPLVCAPVFFRFAVHGGKVILLLNHENYNHYGFHDGYDG